MNSESVRAGQRALNQITRASQLDHDIGLDELLADACAALRDRGLLALSKAIEKARVGLGELDDARAIAHQAGELAEEERTRRTSLLADVIRAVQSGGDDAGLAVSKIEGVITSYSSGER